MSDIAIDLPFYIVAILIGADYWPVTLFVGAAGLYFAATRLRGGWRIVCIVVSLLFAAEACFGIYGRFVGF
ncbi:hypothetical protein [Burkholderia sp. BCC1999]|uniref:hypothetical protein n=1 Tax=Burkholderia sp. BCC1999 TaxID=2817448 RepID=UPI002AC31629|nr:hypothetical protein [Burkholderia sp. BCC1999]